jgi:ribonuclease HII
MLDLAWEKSLWRQGAKIVAGTDESGRGCLAGPVVAACVALGPDFRLPKNLKTVRDSKLIPLAERQRLYDFIIEKIPLQAVAIIDHQVIDQINILQASLLAMRQASEQIKAEIDHLLIDGNKEIKGLTCRQTAVVDGDYLVFSIAAASILAKVTRDRLMEQYHLDWPQYKFNEHKGYATKEHIALINEHGPCPIHRLSFSPLKQMVDNQLFHK